MFDSYLYQLPLPREIQTTQTPAIGMDASVDGTIA